MAEMPGNGGGERQAQRRQADNDIRIEGRELGGEIGGQRLQHRERRLIDDERCQRMLPVRKRPDGQADLPSIIQFRRKEGGMRTCRIEGGGRKNILPELMRRGGRMGGRRCGWRHRFSFQDRDRARRTRFSVAPIPFGTSGISTTANTRRVHFIGFFR